MDRSIASIILVCARPCNSPMTGAQSRSYSLHWTADFPTRLRLRFALARSNRSLPPHPRQHSRRQQRRSCPARRIPLSDDRSALGKKPLAALGISRGSGVAAGVDSVLCRAGRLGCRSIRTPTIPPRKTNFIRNGVFAALPNAFGVSNGYGNDPLTFVEKTNFTAATCDLRRIGIG